MPPTHHRLKPLESIFRLISATSANLAQLVEQLIRNQQVAGSNPVVGSNANLLGSTPGGFVCWQYPGKSDEIM